MVYVDSFDMNPEPYWAKAWVKGMTPKINIFFWILLTKILTIDNLMKRGFNIGNRCYLCKNDVESANHLTLHFSYTKKIWERVCGLMSIGWVFPDTMQRCFASWKPPSNNSLILRLWDFILPYLCWHIWKECNDRVFRGVESNLD